MCQLLKYRPAFPGFTCGQVVNMLNGKKVGVHDMQNIGRIIMADSMTFASFLGGKKLGGNES
jgi:hypothetical protein